ncbi:tetratricopeptide repeat protein [Thermaurantiacus sp.]
MAQPPLPPAARADEAFLREVDEEYRRDAVQTFLKEWGRWILLAVGAGLLAFAGFLFWREQTEKTREAHSEKLFLAVRAIEAGESAQADAPLAEVRAAGTAGQRAMASLIEAALLTNRGDRKAAQRLLDAVAADPDVAAPFRDLAAIQALRLQADSLAPEAIIARARPFLEGDSPWFPAVAELAAIAHLRAGREADAAALFLRLARTAEAPETQRDRAEQMAAMLGQDTSAQTESRLPQVASLPPAEAAKPSGASD